MIDNARKTDATTATSAPLYSFGLLISTIANERMISSLSRTFKPFSISSKKRERVGKTKLPS